MPSPSSDITMVSAANSILQIDASASNEFFMSSPRAIAGRPIKRSPNSRSIAASTTKDSIGMVSNSSQEPCAEDERQARSRKALLGEPIDPKRSALMARVRHKHSKPEMAVRRMAHRLAYRFRLHRRDLPGTPDLVFPS